MKDKPCSGRTTRGEPLHGLFSDARVCVCVCAGGSLADLGRLATYIRGKGVPQIATMPLDGFPAERNPSDVVLHNWIYYSI
jgi:hypothetical protein